MCSVCIVHIVLFRSGVANTTASLGQYFCSHSLKGHKVAVLLMTNSHYFISFSSNFLMTFLRTSYFPHYTCQKPIRLKFFRHFNRIDLPRKIFSPLRNFPTLKIKELNLTVVKSATQACQVGRMLP